MMRKTLTLVALGILMAGCMTGGPVKEDGRITDPQALTSVLWQWTGTTSSAENTTVIDPTRYTIRLNHDGRAQVRFDCNRGGGGYEVAEGKLSFGPMMSTKMACGPDSQDYLFARDLHQVTSFYMEKGSLFLGLANGGTMAFRPGTGDE